MWEHVDPDLSCLVHKYRDHSDELPRYWKVDPYLKEVNDEIVYRWYCDPCWEQRKDDV